MAVVDGGSLVLDVERSPKKVVGILLTRGNGAASVNEGQ